jgi:hypothetical protein
MGRLACKAVYNFRRRSSSELDAVGARRRLALDCSFVVAKPVAPQLAASFICAAMARSARPVVPSCSAAPGRSQCLARADQPTKTVEDEDDNDSRNAARERDAERNLRRAKVLQFIAHRSILILRFPQ